MLEENYEKDINLHQMKSYNGNALFKYIVNIAVID